MSGQPLPHRAAAVTADVIAEHSARRRHLVIHLSGAHAYGFPSEDSDVDLKAVHIEATKKLVGLHTAPPTVNDQRVIDGVEIDYTSNELAIAIGGLLKGDGNMIERLLSQTALATDPCLESLRPHVLAALSQRVYRHYQGFARNQARQVAEAQTPSAKHVLYVLRTTLTGAHLLRERVCEPDLTVLAGHYGMSAVPELVREKQSAERGALPAHWKPRIDALLIEAFTILDDALAQAALPEEPPNAAALEGWLLDVRREYW